MGTASIAGGPPNQVFGLVAAAGPGFLAVPAFGNVFIDLGSAIVLGASTLSPDGVGSLSVPIPPASALRGTSLWFQAYAIDVSGLAGAFSGATARQFFLR